jgi:hypothetical protein
MKAFYTKIPITEQKIGVNIIYKVKDVLPVSSKYLGKIFF